MRLSKKIALVLATIMATSITFSACVDKLASSSDSYASESVESSSSMQSDGVNEENEVSFSGFANLLINGTITHVYIDEYMWTGYQVDQQEQIQSIYITVAPSLYTKAEAEEYLAFLDSTAVVMVKGEVDSSEEDSSSEDIIEDVEYGTGIGNRCPDFTAKTYTEEEGIWKADGEDFILSQKIGKVCIINFWETWCTACIEELPEFDEVKEEYGDSVEVLALVGQTSTIDGAAEWMNGRGWEKVTDKKDWTEFSLTVGYMPATETVALGVSSMLPRTVIIDKSGLVVHAQNGKMSKAQIEEIITPLL